MSKRLGRNPFEKRTKDHPAQPSSNEEASSPNPSHAARNSSSVISDSFFEEPAEDFELEGELIHLPGEGTRNLFSRLLFDLPAETENVVHKAKAWTRSLFKNPRSNH